MWGWVWGGGGDIIFRREASIGMYGGLGMTTVGHIMCVWCVVSGCVSAWCEMRVGVWGWGVVLGLRCLGCGA